MRSYYKHKETGELLALTDEDQASMTTERKRTWKKTEVVHLRAKADGRYLTIEKAEYEKYGKPEKDAFEKVPSPEERDEKALADALALGAVEEPKDDEQQTLRLDPPATEGTK
jgi:hypothetical protein